MFSCLLGASLKLDTESVVKSYGDRPAVTELELQLGKNIWRKKKSLESLFSFLSQV